MAQLIVKLKNVFKQVLNTNEFAFGNWYGASIFFSLKFFCLFYGCEITTCLKRQNPKCHKIFP